MAGRSVSKNTILQLVLFASMIVTDPLLCPDSGQDGKRSDAIVLAGRQTNNR